FCDEVIPWAESKFNLSKERINRALSGYSNGGALALTAAVDRPESFGYSLPYSIAAYDRDALKESVKGKSLPQFSIHAGTLETFIRGSKEANQILTDSKAKVKFTTHVSGHDIAMWSLAFHSDIQTIFPLE